MCLGALAQALCLQMAAKFLPSPSVSAASSSSSVSDQLTTTRDRYMIPPVTPAHNQQDGLPKAFVASLRVLFDILDEDKDGLVPLAEIKERWQRDDGPSGLPVNVIDSLSKVTPKSGKLSFERFCSGLRLALANNQGRSPDYRGPPSARNNKQPRPTTATVRPNVVHPMRTNKSAPQLRNSQDFKKSRSLSENDTRKSYEMTKLLDSVPEFKPAKKPHRYSTGNYEQVYYARQQPGDRSSLDSYENHHPHVNGGVKVLSRQSQRSSKGHKTKQEEVVPRRKDIPPDPLSHSDYMDYADLYHSPISSKNKDPRNRAASPTSSSTSRASRALSPAARPTSPTRPVSPTVMTRDSRTVTSRDSRSAMSRDSRPMSPDVVTSRPMSPSSVTSRPMSPTSTSMSPTSRQVRPAARVSDREPRRRSASRERKTVRQLKYESPSENGIERISREHSRDRSPERRKPPPGKITAHFEGWGVNELKKKSLTLVSSDRGSELHTT